MRPAARRAQVRPLGVFTRNAFPRRPLPSPLTRSGLPDLRIVNSHPIQGVDALRGGCSVILLTVAHRAQAHARCDHFFQALRSYTMQDRKMIILSAVGYTVLWTVFMIAWTGARDVAAIGIWTLCGVVNGLLWYWL